MPSIAALVAVVALAPLLVIVVGAFGAESRTLALLLRPRTIELIGSTLQLTAVVCTLSLVAGIGIAWATTCIRLPFPRFGVVLACLPLAVPSFVGAFAWASTFPHATGFWPLVLVLTVTTVPLVTVPVIGAFVRADRSLEVVARTLGRGPVRAFFCALLPQVLPAAFAGTLLVALYTISDFGAPAMLRYQTLTTSIQALFSGGGRETTAVLSLPLIALAVLCIIGEQRVRRLSETGRLLGRARDHRPPRAQRMTVCIVMLVLMLIAVTAVILPLVALVIRSLSADRYASTPLDLFPLAMATFVISGLAALFATAMGLPIAVFRARHPRLTTPTILESALYLSHGIPGIVMALAFVAVALAVVPAIYQTLVLLIIAFGIMHSGIAVGSSRAAIHGVPAITQHVARTLGRTPITSWWAVTVPNALPGIAAGWILATAAVMKELPATLLLRPLGVETLATELWNKTTIGAYGAAAGPGIVLVIVGLIPALLLAHTTTTRMRR